MFDHLLFPTPLPKTTILSHVAEGIEPFLLDLPLLKNAPIVFITIDDLALHRIYKTLQILFPDRNMFAFPGWDCVPYDRLSPRKEVLGERASVLTTLATAPMNNDIMVTSVSAFMQKVPPPSIFKNARFSLTKGQELSHPALIEFLQNKGYHRVDVVHEPGEYTIRGHLIDIFPVHKEYPIRLDLFGDEIESIKTFDPLSQRTEEHIGEIELVAASELLLTPQTIQNFRQHYRTLFHTSKDRLYETISSGHSYVGMEHWLPLFYEGLVPIDAYLPQKTIYLCDAQIESVFLNRLQNVQEHYDLRKRDPMNKKNQEAYHPCPPESLYRTAQNIEQWQQESTTIKLERFDPAPHDTIPLNMESAASPSFAAARYTENGNLIENVIQHLQELTSHNKKILLTSINETQQERLIKTLQGQGFSSLHPFKDLHSFLTDKSSNVHYGLFPIEHGFSSPRLSLLTDQDIFGERQGKTYKKRRRSDLFIREAASLKSGDFVVHIDHGIGRYENLHTVIVNHIPHDCLCIVYDNEDKLFVPVENMETISRYGGENTSVTLDKLGSSAWQARKAKVNKRLEDIAEKLLAIAAQRQLHTSDKIYLNSSPFHEFCARFPYVETEDQIKAIEDTLADLESGKTMDRLICGDVGFGKTEVALRTAFAVASSGKQVAVVVPTTLLCRQHYENFKKRFDGFGLEVAQLSRLTPKKEVLRTQETLKSGDLPIVVGTQSLLSPSLNIKNLGLIIIDEEQHFGVKQKERLKEMQASAHVLTLTATPIPRTLQLSLTGVKDLSIIATPPVDRLAVQTFVMPFDSMIIREALLREKYRGGQVFYVSPRIEYLQAIAEQLSTLVPEMKVALAHGQLPPRLLETTMLDFYEKKYDILLATNIIESGLDVPSVNTLFIDRADLFGLAQLYQLRGRVGRGKVKSYAYFLLPSHGLLTSHAQKRLDVMQTLDSLGAGFQLASYDMDIRGAGNILGEQQSGHVREVGIELYQQMLEDAVHKIKDQKDFPESKALYESWTPQINLNLSILIPELYVPTLSLRLDLYQRASHLKNEEEIKEFREELIDRFGPLPLEVDNLLNTIRVKNLCRSLYIEKIDAGDKGAVVTFFKNQFPYPEALIQYIQNSSGTIRLRPDHKLFCVRSWATPPERLEGTLSFLFQLQSLCA